MISRYEKVIDTVADYISHEDKNIRNAAITVLLNYSVAFLSRKDDNQGRVQCIAVLVESIDSEEDPQNYMRILAAIGNLIFEDTEIASLANDFGVEEKLTTVEKFKGKDVYDKSKGYATEIIALCKHAAS